MKSGTLVNAVRTLLLTIAALLAATTVAHAGSGPTQPMLAAADSYATRYATVQDWSYVDRLALYRGDYRRAYVTLEFLDVSATFRECSQRGTDCHDIDGNMQWEVQARVVRCGPGWYVVSTPLDRNRCQWRTLTLPAWDDPLD